MISQNNSVSNQILARLKEKQNKQIYDLDNIDVLVSILQELCYDDISYLGEGQFGLVLQALNFQTMQKVALKITKVPTTIESDYEDILKESQILEQLRSPYVVDCISFKIHQKQNKIFFIIAMELCQTTLDHCLIKLKDHKKDLDEKIKFKIVMQIFLGVQFIHDKNIMHRDLKPQNIFMKDGDVKIGDFGFSTNAVNDQKLKSLKGTPFFTAPEVFGENYDKRAEIYTLGIILLMIDNPLVDDRQFNLAAGYFQLGQIPPNLKVKRDTILYKFACKMINTDPQQRLTINHYVNELNQYIQQNKIQIPDLNLNSLKQQQQSPQEQTIKEEIIQQICQFTPELNLEEMASNFEKSWKLFVQSQKILNKKNNEIIMSYLTNQLEFMQQTFQFKYSNEQNYSQKLTLFSEQIKLLSLLQKQFS